MTLCISGRPAWHYVEVRRHAIHIFLVRTRAGQVDVDLYGTVLKSGWGEVLLMFIFCSGIFQMLEARIFFLSGLTNLPEM